MTKNIEETMEVITQLESMETEICQIPMIFASMFKDEINANDEQKLFNGIKNMIVKYSQQPEAIRLINDYTSILTGGASLNEILHITREEAENPTLETEMTVDDSCRM